MAERSVTKAWMSRRDFLRSTAVVAAGAGLPVLASRPAVAGSAPSGPAALLVQGLTDSDVRLIWSAVPGATGYRVYRDGKQVAQPSGTNLVDTGRSPATAYTYGVAAVVPGGESATLSASVTTQAAVGTAAPAAVTGLVTGTVTATAVTLKWRTSPSASVRGYRILRGAPGTDPATWVQVGTSDGTASFTVSNLLAGQAYGFAVRCVDRNGQLSAPATLTATTLAGSPGAAPAAVSSSSVTLRVASSSRIDVVWGASATAVAAYEILRDGAVVARVESPLRRYWSDNGLAAGSRHSYQVRAMDSYGQLSAATTAKVATTLATGAVRILRGPFLQYASADAVLVTWWTNIPAPSTVSYGVGGLTEQVIDGTATHFHAMLVGGLAAGTAYQYQVASGSAISATGTMRTSRAAGDAFTLSVVGDYGGGSAQETRIANLIAGKTGDLLLTVGDNVYPDCQDPDPATAYSDFDARFYKPYGPVLAKRVVYTTNGNKEYYGDGAMWRNVWMLNNQRWYSTDWGDVHLLVLDSEQDYAVGSPQYVFAANDLAASASRPWRIVLVHRPPYSSATANSSALTVRSTLVPLFETSQVHLVLSGNTHNYERTHPLRGGVPAAGGVTYIVTGGGGNGLVQFSATQPSWSAFRKAVYQHLELAVSPTELTVTCVDDLGALVDGVTVQP